MRRKRRTAQAGEFQDPLKNYEPIEYADDLERALCDGLISKMQITPFDTIAATTTIQQAIEKMDKMNIACLIVAENRHIKGVFTERDVLAKVAENFEQIKNESVATVMTSNIVVAYNTDSPAKAVNLMAVGGFRHIPVLDVDDNIVGVLGSRRTTSFIHQHFH